MSTKILKLGRVVIALVSIVLWLYFMAFEGCNSSPLLQTILTMTLGFNFGFTLGDFAFGEL